MPVFTILLDPIETSNYQDACDKIEYLFLNDFIDQNERVSLKNQARQVYRPHNNKEIEFAYSIYLAYMKGRPEKPIDFAAFEDCTDGYINGFLNAGLRGYEILNDIGFKEAGIRHQIL